MPAAVCELRRGCRFLPAMSGLTFSQHHQKVPACRPPDWASLCPKDTWCGVSRPVMRPLLRPVMSAVLVPVRIVAAEAMTSYRHSKGQTIDSQCFSLKTSSMSFWKKWQRKKLCLSTTSIYFLSLWGSVAFPLQLSLHDRRICLHKLIFRLMLGSRCGRTVFLLSLFQGPMCVFCLNPVGSVWSCAEGNWFGNPAHVPVFPSSPQHWVSWGHRDTLKLLPFQRQYKLWWDYNSESGLFPFSRGVFQKHLPFLYFFVEQRKILFAIPQESEKFQLLGVFIQIQIHRGWRNPSASSLIFFSNFYGFFGNFTLCTLIKFIPQNFHVLPCTIVASPNPQNKIKIGPMSNLSHLTTGAWSNSPRPAT